MIFNTNRLPRFTRLLAVAVLLFGSCDAHTSVTVNRKVGPNKVVTADVELAVEVPGSVRIGEPFRVRWTLTSASTEEVLIAAPLGPMDVFVLDSDGKYLPMTDEGRRSLNSPPSEIAQKGWGSALVLQPLRPTASEEVDLMPLFQFRPGEYTLEVGTEVRRTDIDHAQRRMPLKLAHMKFTVTP